MIGIFLDVRDLKVKVALAGLASASFLLALFIEVQASRDAAFTKRSLGRLIQASIPSSLFAHAVAEIAIGEANKRGASNCLLQEKGQREGYVINLIFIDDMEQEAKGYFEFDHERLAQWSLLEESNLPDEIAAEMFDRSPIPTANPLDHWDDLTTFIGKVSKGLYPNSVRNGAFGISANTETVEVGVPFPVHMRNKVPGQTRDLLLDGERVPFLMFSRDDLATLAGQSNMEASETVAGWLASAWGTPTVLRPGDADT